MSSKTKKRHGQPTVSDPMTEDDDNQVLHDWRDLAQVLVDMELLTDADLEEEDPFQYLGNYCLHDALAYGRIRSAGELRVVLERKFTMPCCGTIGITVADLVRYGQCPIEGCPDPLECYYSFCHDDFVDARYMTHCYRCHTCYDWHYWHCLECDRCTYYAYDDTAPKCEWCGYLGEVPDDPDDGTHDYYGERFIQDEFPPIYVPALHFIAFTIMVFAFLWQLRIPLTHPFSFGRHLVFVTNWAILMAILYFIVAMVWDLYPTKPRLRAARDRLFLLATVSSVVVTTMYWGLYSIDPGTLVPPDGRYPFPLMVLAHGAGPVLLLLEMSLVSHTTLSLKTTLLDQTIFAVSYLLWSYVTFTQNGIWPYPFQATFGVSEHLMFDSGALVLVCLTGLSVRKLNASVHPDYAPKHVAAPEPGPSEVDVDKDE